MKCLLILSCALIGISTANGELLEAIVGGKSSKEGKFPFIVSLRRSGHPYCAGSILNNHWVITAAHCISGIRDPVTVVAGSYKLGSGGTVHHVHFFDVFSTYDSHKIIHDIGLIKVVEPFVFNSNVKAINIDQSYIPAGKTVTMMGWGQTSVHGNVPDKLQYIKLSTIDNLQCSHTLQTQIYTSQICTLTKVGDGICNGDSGGPLIYDGKLVGIASYSRPCAIGYPDVYTRVYYYINWIHDEIRKYGP